MSIILKINDTYGHIQGDIVLKQIAGHLRTNFRKDDICCRCGGEEFAVLMPTIDKKQSITVLNV